MGDQLKLTITLMVLALMAPGCAMAEALDKPLLLEGQVRSNPSTSEGRSEESERRKEAIFDSINDLKLTSTREKSGLAKKAGQKLTSLGNFALDLRGFDWSVEGADVATEEKTSYKNASSREFAKRRGFDQKELDLVYGIFQTAMSLGITNGAKREQSLAEKGRRRSGRLPD